MEELKKKLLSCIEDLDNIDNQLKNMNIDATLCPICNYDTTVIDSRYNSKGIRYRRRKCLACGHRFKTREVVIW